MRLLVWADDAWTAFDSSGTEDADDEGKASFEFTFGATDDHLVPIGRHVLVLGVNDGSTTSAYEDGNGDPVAVHVRFKPRCDLPAVTVEVP